MGDPRERLVRQHGDERRAGRRRSPTRGSGARHRGGCHDPGAGRPVQAVGRTAHGGDQQGDRRPREPRPHSTSERQRNVSDVGPTWGSEITKKAIIAVIVFFIVVVLYISFRFEWKMALAALIAVIHDLLVTAGIYSLFGFQVTPDTVIAILTILGYSLYDTVVVFDRIRESTRGLGASGRMTYEDVVNLSMNQVLARSINTSLVAILPVLSVLVIGAEILGASTLQYFGLALVIGLTSGAYSSIFIASPILSQLKEREPRYSEHPPEAREPRHARQACSPRLRRPPCQGRPT